MLQTHNRSREGEVGSTQSSIQEYLDTISRLAAELPASELAQLVELLDEARLAGRKVVICGNGGSASTASHWANDLSKGASGPSRPRMRVLAATDSVALLTAYANDKHYDNIFAEQVLSWIEPRDIVIAISGSGNSSNVLRAVECAREMGAATVGLIGFGGGKLASMVDLAIVVNSSCMEQVEDTHLIIGHVITTALRERATASTQQAPANGQAMPSTEMRLMRPDNEVGSDGSGQG